ncbi:hypothetical protein [Sphingomonas sp. VDB2]|uniref:hypothetical protein n=1 Tax=Sphingomonas sp. VDB2 TaxID=3228751 RepID=UPI003A80A7E4
MPTADTTARDYTAAEVTAYEAYLSAIAEHNIICARTAATTREKMDAATAQLKAFGRFCEIAGYPDGSPRSPDDIRTIGELKEKLGRLTECARSAWAMLRAVDAMGVIHRIPEGVDRQDHGACVCLVQDAQVVLREAVSMADGE